jgi:hypothetical protein
MRKGSWAARSERPYLPVPLLPAVSLQSLALLVPRYLLASFLDN